ncbi:hypothetical protein DFH08DRAFT_1039277 [Mycena albidolilacea]|uniref:Uncharacterized protein n=1 Tax=Mycena albidolilacea TaxID=1033008 RepID=A0AAD7F1T9_9AGAR|nr:hypothetical protein DFH08DRAFT_1039277 [Mycena albidolilacea]
MATTHSEAPSNYDASPDPLADQHQRRAQEAACLSSSGCCWYTPGEARLPRAAWCAQGLVGDMTLLPHHHSPIPLFPQQREPSLPQAYGCNTSANAPRRQRHAGLRSRYHSACKIHAAPLRRTHTLVPARALSFPQKQDRREPSDSTVPYQFSRVEVRLVLSSPHHGYWQRKLSLPHEQPARLVPWIPCARSTPPPRSTAALDTSPVQGWPNDAHGTRLRSGKQEVTRRRLLAAAGR